MGIQQELLNRLGDELVKKFQEALATRSATGRTAESIYYETTENTLDVRGPRYLGALEYGRKPTNPNATAGSPTLFEMIKEWALAKGVVSSAEKGSEGLGIVWAITKKIHKKGTLLYYTTDHYGKTKPSGIISDVIEQLNYASLLNDITALSLNEFTSQVVHELKTLE
jgi:hypothetical protein